MTLSVVTSSFPLLIGWESSQSYQGALPVSVGPGNALYNPCETFVSSHNPICVRTVLLVKHVGHGGRTASWD